LNVLYKHSSKLVSIKNQHAPDDRNGFNLLGNQGVLHIVIIIFVISFIVVVCVFIIMTLTTTLAKIGAG